MRDGAMASARPDLLLLSLDLAHLRIARHDVQRILVPKRQAGLARLRQ